MDTDANRARKGSRRRLFLIGAAVGVLLLFVAAGLLGRRILEGERLQSQHAALAARELTERLERLLALEPVHDYGETEPIELGHACAEAVRRLDRAEFSRARTERLALEIATGAAQRVLDDLDGAVVRLERVVHDADAAHATWLDVWLRRTPPDVDAPTRARIELAWAYLDRGDADRALSLARAAAERDPGPAAREKRTTVVADGRLVLARALEESGDHEAAAVEARHVVDESPPRDRNHAMQRWSALRLLARCADSGGSLDEAVALLRQVRDVAVEHFPPDDPRIPESRYRLAFRLHDAGAVHAPEALREYRTAIDARSARSSDVPLQLSDWMANYALLLKQSGKPRESEPWLSRALANQLRLVPGDDRGTATLMNNLGTLRHALGDLDGAESMLGDALAMRRRLFPDGHADVAQTLQNLAWLHQVCDELDTAIEQGGEAAAILRRVTTPPSLDLAIALDNLGICLSDAKRNAAGEPLAREALAIEDALGLGVHETRAQTLDNLALILHRLDRHAEALPHARESLSIRRALFGDEHEDVVESWRHVGWIEGELQNHAEAVVCLRAALAAQDVDDELRADPELTIELGEALELAGESAQAADVYAAALESCIARSRSWRWTIAETSERVAFLAWTLGRCTEYEPLLVEAASDALSAERIPLSARARTVEALIELYRNWPPGAADADRARRDARVWRERLDAADGF